MRSTLERLLACLGALLLVLTVTPVTQWCAQALSAPWPREGRPHAGQTLIVLGGGMYALPGQTPTANESTHLRIVFALWLERQQPYRRIVLVGGGGAAESMRDYLTAHGVPPEKLTLESRSLTTRENAQETKVLLGQLPEAGELRLITSDFHSRRAAGCFRRAGLAVEAIPAPDILKRSSSWSARWQCFWHLTDETARLLYYWARQWI